MSSPIKKKKTFNKTPSKSKVKAFPRPRAGHLLLCERHNTRSLECSLDGNSGTVYLLGGYSEVGPLCDVWKYGSDVEWVLIGDESTFRHSPLPRYETDGCILNSSMFVFGGFKSDGESVSILNDLWCFNVFNCKWSCIAEECPAPERSGHVMVAIDDKSFIIHGGNCMGPLNDMWMYDTFHKRWHCVITEELTVLKPCGRWMHSAVYIESTNNLAIFGGITQSNDSTEQPTYLNDLWVMNLDNTPDTWKWCLVSYSSIGPSPRDLPAMIAIDNNILILGGFGLLEMSDLESDDGENNEVNHDTDNFDDNSSHHLLDDINNKNPVVNNDQINNFSRQHYEIDSINTTTCIKDDGGVVDTNKINVDQIRLDHLEVTDRNEDVGVIDDVDDDKICHPEISTDDDGKVLNYDDTGKDTTNSNGDMEKHTVIVRFSEENIKENSHNDDVDDDDDDSIALDYLEDSWNICIDTSNTIDLNTSKMFLECMGNNFIYPAVRGTKSIIYSGEIMFFGGYDGEKFYSNVAKCSIQSYISELSNALLLQNSSTILTNNDDDKSNKIRLVDDNIKIGISEQI